MPDATFGTKKISDLFEEDQWDMFVENPDSPWSMVPGEEDWALPIDGYDWNKLGYARNITVDDLARLRLGQVSMEEVVDKYGNDPTPEVLDYVTNRMTRLSNNPDFVDYIKKRNENPDFDAYTALKVKRATIRLSLGLLSQRHLAAWLGQIRVKRAIKSSVTYVTILAFASQSLIPLSQILTLKRDIPLRKLRNLSQVTCGIPRLKFYLETGERLVLILIRDR